MSYTRKIFFSFLFFGVLMGIIFPFYAILFVNMKEGMAVYFIIGCIMAGLMLGFLNFIIYRFVVGRIVQNLSAVFTRIAQGNLTEKVVLHSNDHFGKLSEAIEKMRIHLVEVVEQLSKGIFILTKMAKQSSGLTLHSKNFSQKAVKEMNEVMSRIQHQIRQTNNILQMVEDANQQIENGNRLMKKTLEDTLTSNEMVQKGKNMIHESLKELENIHHIITDAADSMQLLIDRSVEISKIAEMISTIAKQTQILALNASIEAERAGEHGKGFLVVAGEIRKLAEETNFATVQIHELIQQVEKESKERIRALNKDFTDMEQYVNALKEGDQALTISTNRFTKTEESLTHTVNVLDMLKKDLLDILQSVRLITETNNESASSLQVVTETANKQLENIEESSSFSMEMEKLATDLTKHVEKFTL